MKRDAFLDRIRGEDRPWDVIVIGGGATGLGAAVEAASRGYRTVLLEQSDFAKGTSSRSTKLVHGGVRYLQQGNVSLVLEALRERGRLLENAPHLVHDLTFVLPAYSWWERIYYGIGLKAYDVLAGKYSFGKSRLLSTKTTLKQIPGVHPEGLRGGVAYHDGQFDDARLALSLARTAADLGAVVVNYARVEGLIKERDKVKGVVVRELESDQELQVRGRAVINATGVFVDAIRKQDEPGTSNLVSPSQGIHIVLDRSFFPSDRALLIPRTEDGRVLFAIPWHDHVLLGTTDTPVDTVCLEPQPQRAEVDYLLAYAAKYLAKTPTRADVLSTFAGLRPLVGPDDDADTASIPRDHVVRISTSGLITVTGGKWTTYRKMGEDTIDEAVRVAGLERRPSGTSELRLHGWQRSDGDDDVLDVYGADRPRVEEVLREGETGEELLHPSLPYRRGEVTWAVRYEMARTVEDVLARRTRSLMLNSRAAITCAPEVARLMADELGHGDDWMATQIHEFRQLAREYLPEPNGSELLTETDEEISFRK